MVRKMDCNKYISYMKENCVTKGTLYLYMILNTCAYFTECTSCCVKYGNWTQHNGHPRIRAGAVNEYTGSATL